MSQDEQQTIAADIPNIPTHIANLTNTDPAIQLNAVYSLRRVLSLEDNPPIDNVIRSID